MKKRQMSKEPDFLTPEMVLEMLNGVNVDKKGDQRAPNKHFLILLLLARIQHKERPQVHYSDIDRKGMSNCTYL